MAASASSFCSARNTTSRCLSDTERFHARFFTIRGPKRSAQRRVTCGLLAMNGEQHRRNRRIVKEPFGLRAISTYGETIVRLTDEMLDDLAAGRSPRHRRGNAAVHAARDEHAAVRPGRSGGGLSAGRHDRPLGDAEPGSWRRRAGAERAVSWISYEELLGFAEELEAEILGMIRRRRESSEQGNDVLSILVRTHDEEGGLSDEELVGQAAVLFWAAHMTTAHSLTWTLLLLAQHPSVMRRLWQELTLSNGMPQTAEPPEGRVRNRLARCQRAKSCRCSIA